MGPKRKQAVSVHVEELEDNDGESVDHFLEDKSYNWRSACGQMCEHDCSHGVNGLIYSRELGCSGEQCLVSEGS